MSDLKRRSKVLVRSSERDRAEETSDFWLWYMRPASSWLKVAVTVVVLAAAWAWVR